MLHTKVVSHETVFKNQLNWGISPVLLCINMYSYMYTYTIVFEVFILLYKVAGNNCRTPQ